MPPVRRRTSKKTIAVDTSKHLVPSPSPVLDSSNSEVQNDNLIVSEYMRQQYRPYSIKDIQLNLHNKFNKSKLATILESLVQEGELVSKVIGKSTYYVYKELPVEQDYSSLEEYQHLDEQVRLINVEIQDARQSMFQ